MTPKTIEVLSRVETRSITFFFILVFFMLYAPSELFAGETNVVNSVSVTASSGGNSVSSGGSVSESSSSGYVHVYSEVNGVVVEDYEEEKRSSTGESIEIYYEKKLLATTSSSTVSPSVSNSVTGTEKKGASFIKKGADGATGNATTTRTHSNNTYGIGSAQNTTEATSAERQSATSSLRTTIWNSFWGGFAFYVRSFFFF